MRTFIDTCVVNFMLDFGEQIHDGAEPHRELSEQDCLDIDALQRIAVLGQRAGIQMAISPHTYFEIQQTRDKNRLSDLDQWFQELWDYWRHIVVSDHDLPTFVEADDERVRVLGSENLAVLPDISDRVLLCDALAYRCDLFCTRDRSTIVKHRERLRELPLEIVTPAEWWRRLGPYA